MQVPLHAVLQHTPDAQLPEVHSIPLTQVAPLLLSAMQAMPMHVEPVAHSDGSAHVVLHFVPAVSHT
jgi:hypothetical protein